MKLLLNRTGKTSVEIQEADFLRAMYKWVQAMHNETHREIHLETDNPADMPFVIVPNPKRFEK